MKYLKKISFLKCLNVKLLKNCGVIYLYYEYEISTIYFDICHSFLWINRGWV